MVLETVLQSVEPKNKNVIWLHPDPESGKLVQKVYGVSGWEVISGAGGDTTTKLTWEDSSNMNDFKVAGVYTIYGISNGARGNLPILDDAQGHSFEMRLTVLDSSLRVADGDPTEICVTQIAVISNRCGGEGNIYIRSYNSNNSPFREGWNTWKRVQTFLEGFVFTDTKQINPDLYVQQISGVTGLNSMVDNGVYSGVYVNEEAVTGGNNQKVQINPGAVAKLETFTMTVVNDYAATTKVGAMLGQSIPRTIVQFKYSVNALDPDGKDKHRAEVRQCVGDYTIPSNWTAWTSL